jgi:hypothetical protein
MRVCCDWFTLQVLVEKLAGSCDLTDRYRAYRTSSTHSVCLTFCSCAGGEWGSLNLGRRRSHLGARGVQADERAAEGQVDSWLLRRPYKIRCTREGAALTVGSCTCFIKLTRRLRVGELAEPLCSNHDKYVPISMECQLIVTSCMSGSRSI